MGAAEGRAEEAEPYLKEAPAGREGGACGLFVGRAGRGGGGAGQRLAVRSAPMAAAAPPPPHETAGWRAYLDLFAASGPVSPPPPALPCAKAALLIEPRAHPLLEPVARHFASLLAPHGWALVIAHGTANEREARAAAARIGPGRVALMNLGVPDLPIPIYNALLKTPPLWRALAERGVQKVLVFQTDTLLLKSGAALEAFVGYDYVGAPWRPGLWGKFGIEHLRTMNPVGNGGLSLRSVRAMLHVTETMQARADMMSRLNEDFVLSRLCKEAGFSIPSAERAAAFASETVYHPAPCGLHKPHLDAMPPRTLDTWLRRAAREHFGAIGEERVARAAAEAAAAGAK